MKISYANGVKDSEGNMVIRPLTKEEKDFLNKFTNEYEKGFVTTDGLHKELIETHSEEVEELKVELKELLHLVSKNSKSRIKRDKYFKLTREEKRAYLDTIKGYYLRINEIRDRLSEIDYIKITNDVDNAHRRDISNTNIVVRVSDLHPFNFRLNDPTEVGDYPEHVLFDQLKSKETT